jgi:phage-related protein
MWIAIRPRKDPGAFGATQCRATYHPGKTLGERKQMPRNNTGPSARASVWWEGDSLGVLKSWPRDVQRDIGLSLQKIQEGERATLPTRPMQSIGQGVFELKTADEATWYRVIYLARIENTIYVLDSFTKQSRKTEKNDLNRTKARLRNLKQRLQEERIDAKRKSGR